MPTTACTGSSVVEIADSGIDPTTVTTNQYFHDIDDESVIYRVTPDEVIEELLPIEGGGFTWLHAPAANREYLVPLPPERWHHYMH
jgi:hypothetical protein